MRRLQWTGSFDGGAPEQVRGSTATIARKVGDGRVLTLGETPALDGIG
jgi:hypothetical protein